MAGAGGIEPPNGGIKIPCLTAWLRPNSHRSNVPETGRFGCGCLNLRAMPRHALSIGLAPGFQPAKRVLYGKLCRNLSKMSELDGMGMTTAKGPEIEVRGPAARPVMRRGPAPGSGQPPACGGCFHRTKIAPTIVPATMLNWLHSHPSSL